MSTSSGDSDDLENRKTRFVPRPDAGEGERSTAPEPAQAAPSAVQSDPVETQKVQPGFQAPIESPIAGGTIIGRTRLIGDHSVTAVAPGSSASPHLSSRIGGTSAGKTEFIRSDSAEIEPVVAWVAVVKGPGRGSFRPVYVGMNSVGRDSSQRVPLNFGDETISREQHAYITYDDENRLFYLQDGGKSNLVKRGVDPVTEPVELKAYDLIRLGKTALRFVPCCGPDFNWTDEVPDL